jgi:two-component system sensor histidine kinase MtrB
LTIVCILIAGLSAGFLAVTSYLTARTYRDQSFTRQAVRRADVARLALPGDSRPSAVNAALAPYRERGNFDTVIVREGKVIASEHALDAALPSSARASVTEESEPFHLRVGGTSYEVVARPGVDERSTIYFFFSRANIDDSLRQFRNILAIAWALTLALAAVFGALVAKGALRPIRRAAQQSTATTSRLLGPVAPRTNDEVEQWADSFNGLVEALELKVAELSDAADRERRFTSDVAHELRTPLTALTSSAALLEDHLDELSLGARRPAELLVTEVQRLRELVVELLELARLDAGAETVHVERIDVGASLRAAVEPWRASARFTLAIDADLEACADRARFKRVIDNLIENAIRHGSGVASIRAFASAGRTCIEVTDSGPGVSSADAHRIFERFYKDDLSRTAPGSGLGLAIAAKHAEAMGGTLELANPGEPGARFAFWLRAADRAVEERNVPADGDGTTGRPGRATVGRADPPDRRGGPSAATTTEPLGAADELGLRS